MEKITISIITVCFNSSKTLQKTINSVASQTYDNIEYIIVDGGSNDGTVDIIKKNTHVINKWITEPDYGLYHAMNKGLGMVTGDIVGILNSDDVFFNDNVIENLVSFHILNEIDISVGNIVQCNNQGKIIRKYSSEKWNPQKLKFGFMPPHPAIFINRELFSKYGNFRVDFLIAADYELIVRYFLSHDIKWMYSNIYTTSMLTGGLSSSGLKSYVVITREIKRALCINKINCNYIMINFRFLLKLREYIKV